MSPKVKMFAALGAAGVGLVALFGVLFGTKGSVRSYIAGKYQRIEAESKGRSAVYTSTQTPVAVAKSISPTTRTTVCES